MPNGKVKPGQRLKAALPKRLMKFRNIRNGTLFAHLRALPVAARQLVVGAAQGDQPRFEFFPEGLQRIALEQCKSGDGLHRGQGVLDSMVEFVDQQRLALLRLAVRADVHQHVDRTDQLVPGVE